MKTTLKIAIAISILLIMNISVSASLNKIYKGLVIIDDDDQFVSIGGSVSNASSVLFFSVKENVDRPSTGMISGVLYNSTHIRFERASGQKSVQVYWNVAEFDSSVNVIRGKNSPGKKVDNIYAIPSIDLNSSFIIPGGFTNDGATWNENHYARLRIVNSTIIGLMTSGSSIGAKDYAGWQVVTFNKSRVQRGLLNLSVNATIIDINLTTLVNLNRSFPIFSYTVSDNARSNGVVSGRMMNSTQLRLSRYSQGISGNVSWEIIELPENNTVFSGYSSFSLNEAEKNISISLKNHSKAIAFSPSGATSGLSTGEHNYTHSDVPGYGMFTFNVSNSTLLVLNRLSNDSIAKVGWFVVEFDSNASRIINATVNLTNSSINLTNSTVNVTNSTGNSTNSSLNLTNSTLNSTNSSLNLTNSTLNDTNSSINSTSNVTLNLTPSNTSNSTDNSTNATINSSVTDSEESASNSGTIPGNSRALVINGQTGLAELAKSTSEAQTKSPLQPAEVLSVLTPVQTPVAQNNPRASPLTGSVVDGAQINSAVSAEPSKGILTGLTTFVSSNSKPMLYSMTLILAIMAVYALTLFGMPQKIKSLLFRKDNVEAPKYRLNVKHVQFSKTQEPIVRRKQIREYVPEQTLELKLRPVHITTTPYNKIALPSKHAALSSSLKMSNELLKSVKETARISTNNDGEYENSLAYLNQHRKTLIEGLSKAYNAKP